jgi:tetratricopeptide (TPR) repeat protein
VSSVSSVVDRWQYMKSDAIAFGIAGVVFGLIAGWIIGTQQAAGRPVAPPAAQAASAAPAAGEGTTSRAAVLDETQVKALTSVAEREPTNPKPRVDLANLYFDAERYDDAIKWYAEAVRLSPDDVNVSTDLGVAYYYTNQPDKALAQFAHSLKLNPKHTKTLLNEGIVLAFGKQDLEGATKAWQQVLQIDPAGPEGQAAKRAIESLRSAHPGMAPGSGQKPGA